MLKVELNRSIGIAMKAYVPRSLHLVEEDEVEEGEC